MAVSMKEGLVGGVALLIMSKDTEGNSASWMRQLVHSNTRTNNS